MRFVSEAPGASVDFRAETGQVLIKDRGTEIVLTSVSNQVLVNGGATDWFARRRSCRPDAPSCRYAS
ncbi:MAG: hypothetical protein IBX71_11165 [Candidatus Desulforudis sp.]|nr:hypothetical protein [Desulforudis sp.]